jgi:hypothetical protein
MAQYALPASDISKASWVQLAGNSDANAFDELDEGFGAGRGSGSGPDNATSAWQTDNISNVTRVIECALGAISDPLDANDHIIRARVAKSATGGAMLTGTLRLFQGTTEIAASAPTAITTTAYATISYTLTATEADAIMDYSALRLRLTVVFSSGTSRRARLSTLELETPDAGVLQTVRIGAYENEAVLAEFDYNLITMRVLAIHALNETEENLSVTFVRTSDQAFWSGVFTSGFVSIAIPTTTPGLVITNLGSGKWGGIEMQSGYPV